MPEPQAGIITALVVRSGRSDRTIVHLDGHAAGDLATSLVQTTGLRVGDLLTIEVHAELLRQDEPHRARSRALKLLSTRDRSSGEVEARLAQAGFSSTAIADTVSWLHDLGYLDDRRFVQRYVEEKMRSGWGPRRLQAELARKGVDRALTEECLQVAAADGGAAVRQDENLLVLVERRFGKRWQTDPEATERRLSAFLARRGFGWNEIARIVREFTVRQESGSELSDGED